MYQEQMKSAGSVLGSGYTKSAHDEVNHPPLLMQLERLEKGLCILQDNISLLETRLSCVLCPVPQNPRVDKDPSFGGSPMTAQISRVNYLVENSFTQIRNIIDSLEI